MQEISKLTVQREQLAEKYFYYNGCEYSDNHHDEQTENLILNFAADVLIQILMSEHKESD